MKNIRFCKSRFLVIGLIVAMNLSGCSDFKGEDLENKEYQSEQQERKRANEITMKRTETEEKRAYDDCRSCKRWKLYHSKYGDKG